MSLLAKEVPEVLVKRVSFFRASTSTKYSTKNSKRILEIYHCPVLLIFFCTNIFLHFGQIRPPILFVVLFCTPKWLCYNEESSYMGKMFSMWSNKARIAVLVLALALYVYILVYLKTMYMRSKRLDSIEELALKDEKLMKHIHGLDEQLAARVNRLDDFYEDY